MRQTLKAIRYLESEVSRAEGLEGIVLRYGSLYGAEAMDGYSEWKAEAADRRRWRGCLVVPPHR